MSKPILCIDFDNTIREYNLGWKNGELYGNVLPEFFKWAEKAKEKFQLVVYSSRSKDEKLRKEMIGYMYDQLTIYHGGYAPVMEELSINDFEFYAEKPPAFLTIDDRAITFQGDWTANDLQPEELIKFKPWDKRC
jgi:hypothetical protein